MIHEIARELQAVMRGRGCPFDVVDGTEATKTTTYSRERIVLEHDEGSDDTFSPVRGSGAATRKNPAPVLVVNQAFKATIYAQSPKAGAMPFEHRRRAEQMRDQLLVAIREVAAERCNGWEPRAGRFVQPGDLEKSEVIGGAVYELRFMFERGVKVETWKGEKRPEVTLGAGSLRSTTKVSANGWDDDNDPSTVPANAETACGA